MAVQVSRALLQVWTCQLVFVLSSIFFPSVIIFLIFIKMQTLSWARAPDSCRAQLLTSPPSSTDTASLRAALQG